MMSEGSLKLSLFLLGVIVSASQSLGDIYLLDENYSLLYYWTLLGVILSGLMILVFAPLSEIWTQKHVSLLSLSALSCIALGLSFYFTLSIGQSRPSPPLSNNSKQLIQSHVHIENSSILIYHETDCIQDLVINDTNFQNCSLSCPIDSLRICETFNYMILCISDGNDIRFSKELTLIPILDSLSNDTCESEYKLRYADRVDMELAPGCTLECTTFAEWTDLIEAEEEEKEEWIDYKFKISYGIGVILCFCLIMIMDGNFLIRGRFTNLGDKYAYFLLGSVLLHSATPYLADITPKITLSIYLIIPLLASFVVFISTIFCTHRVQCDLSRNDIPIKTAHIWKQVKNLFQNHKLTLIEIVFLSLSIGMDSSRNTEELYNKQTLFISLHNTKGAIIALPFIAFMGDYLVKRFGASTCLSFSLLCYGLEFIGFGMLKALPFVVIHFLLNPFAYGFGAFIILKFAHVKFAEDIRLPTYGILSCLGVRFFGKSVGVLLKSYPRIFWAYTGSILLFIFTLIHFLKCKWNRKKLPSSDMHEHI